MVRIGVGSGGLPRTRRWAGLLAEAQAFFIELLGFSANRLAFGGPSGNRSRGAADAFGLFTLAGTADHLDFFAREFAPCADGQAAECEGTDAHAAEPLDGGTEHFQNFADLAVAGFADCDFEQRAAGFAAENHDLLHRLGIGRARHRAGIGIARPGHTEFGADGIDEGIIDLTFDRSVVRLDDAETGVREAMGEIAVVGQEHQAGGVEVEPTDGEEAGLGGVVHQIHDRAAFHAGFVGGGHERALGLVEHDVEVPLGLGDAAAIDRDVIDPVGDEDGEFRDDLTIDGDAAGLDHLLAHATGGDARLGEHLLEAFETGFRWALLHRCGV
ncbi:MAG: hypothetical protein PSX37_12615 [bacterium]|nr:hypothetical protein [bacterium]